MAQCEQWRRQKVNCSRRSSVFVLEGEIKHDGIQFYKWDPLRERTKKAALKETRTVNIMIFSVQQQQAKRSFAESAA